MQDISVSIITYNRKDLLRDVIRSLEEQSYPKDKYELVIVDDGSTDGTQEVMEELIEGSFCNIRYLRQDVNRGKSAVRNISVENAKGEIILFLEDDTIADPRLLEEHIKSHRSEPGEKIAVAGLEIVKEISIRTPFGRYLKQSSKRFFDNVHDLIETGDKDMFKGFITFNLSIHRSFLMEEGMFDPAFKYFCEDIELGYRLSKKGLKMKYNPDACIFNVHPPRFDEHCRRNINRGEFSVKLAEKHPDAVDVSIPGGRAKLFLKDIFYPVLKNIISICDERLKIPFPGVLYQKVMDYCVEKGMRDALEKGKNRVICPA
ncbi:MAG: glycosyltransferase [Candidatus Tantalella remota]|nr:glycosyltransferase [Candidatus Tantalella remota]